MKLTAKQITATAFLLAICIVSQYFKNMSVYVTGPIVNTTIILATLACVPISGIILSVIAPITAFFFTGSPIMAAIPLMFPVIMVGNCILVFSVHLLKNKFGKKAGLPVSLLTGSVLKSLFMGLTVILVVLPLFGDSIATKLPKPEMLPAVLAAAKVTFSLTQLITALLGSLLAMIIWVPLKKVISQDEAVL
ncbi:MAG: ECF transporter S component [Clostridiales bacterium]|nr:ECF transporter S component [Clostridiales bacterium]